MSIYSFDECVLLDNTNKNTMKVEPQEVSISGYSGFGATEVEIRGVVRDYDWKPHQLGFIPVQKRVDYQSFYASHFWEFPAIKNVIFNDPATIVFWADGTKTVVKCQDDDIFDPEKGLAMAISKKALGNQGYYCNEFKKWLPKDEEEDSIVVTLVPYDPDSMRASIQRAIKNIENACKHGKE